MTTRVQELQDSIDIANKRLKSARERLDEARKELQASGTCDHRKSRKYEEDRDNGYGKWWKQEIEVCDYCESRRSMYSGSSLLPGRWISYESWRRSDR